MTAEEDKYIRERLSEINLEWQERKVNNIPTNPTECWWTIGELGTLKRFYKIVPFNKCDERGVSSGDMGMYYILYESCSTDENKAGIVGIYEDVEQAKQRAKFQLLVIDNLIKTYCRP